MDQLAALLRFLWTTAMVGRKSKLNGNEVSLSWRAMPSLVLRLPPPKSVREGLGVRLCHASATPHGRTMRRGAPVFATKGRVRLQLNAVVVGVIPAHFRIVVRHPPIR